MYSNPSLVTLRNILHQLKKINPNSKLKDNPSVQYIFEQYRKHQVTDERTCRAKDELLFQAQAYTTYLESIGQYKKLMDIYGKGEVSLEEAARKVGLKLPEKH